MCHSSVACPARSQSNHAIGLYRHLSHPTASVKLGHALSNLSANLSKNFDFPAGQHQPLALYNPWLRIPSKSSVDRIIYLKGQLAACICTRSWYAAGPCRLNESRTAPSLRLLRPKLQGRHEQTQTFMSNMTDTHRRLSLETQPIDHQPRRLSTSL